MNSHEYAPASRQHRISVMSEARARCSCGWAVRGSTRQAEQHAFDHNGAISIGGLQ